MMSRGQALLLLAGVALLTGGLVGPENVMVLSAQPVGPYIEAHLSGDDTGAVLLPLTPTCVAIAQPETWVAWVQRGFPGRLEAGGEACEAAGILDLAAWRDRRPRPEAGPLPRATARFELLHRDGRRLLLRGRFQLASLVGMPFGEDLVAVVADDDRCKNAVTRRVGSLEYRSSGRNAFVLIVGGQRCPVLGFARPPPPARDAP